MRFEPLLVLGELPVLAHPMSERFTHLVTGDGTDPHAKVALDVVLVELEVGVDEDLLDEVFGSADIP